LSPQGTEPGLSTDSPPVLDITVFVVLTLSRNFLPVFFKIFQRNTQSLAGLNIGLPRLLFNFQNYECSSCISAGLLKTTIVQKITTLI